MLSDIVLVQVLIISCQDHCIELVVVLLTSGLLPQEDFPDYTRQDQMLFVHNNLLYVTQPRQGLYISWHKSYKIMEEKNGF